MSAEQALRLTACVVVAVGITALAAADLIGPVAMALVGLTLVGGGWLRARIGRSGAVDSLLTAAVAAFAVVDVLYLAGRVFDALVRFLVLLVLLRLLTARTSREYRDAGLLAFFMPVASAAVSLGAWFSLIFVGFLVAGTMLLVLGHELAEAERSGGPGAARALLAGRGVLTLGLAAATASLLVTLGLFFVIPRIGEATLALTAPSRRMIVGFSDRVELGAIGELEMDSSVAMRIRVGDAGEVPPYLLGELRWRGVVLDYFDGHAWTISRRRRAPLGRRPTGEAQSGAVPGRGYLLTQEVFLEPIGTDTLFAASRALRVRAPAGVVLVDDMGALSLSHHASRLEYTVDSVVGGRVLERLSPAAQGRFLQLPPVPPRVTALAREITRDSTGPAAARALTEYLRRNFRYSLTQERTTTLHPLEDFLFARRAGNCEYFASALAVMLRSIGIPARVVTGFQRGEWNPYGEYFLVRMSDAHAWVEAYVAGSGWLTFDPSPRDERVTATWAGASLFLDALGLRWHRYIVNWSSQDQLAAAATVRQAAGAWKHWRTYWPHWQRPWLWPALVPAVALIAWWAWRRRRPATAWGQRPPDFYRRALRMLARRGLRPERGETAREFALRVGHTAPAQARGFAGITVAYEAVRFGARRLAASEQAEVDEWLQYLARWPGQEPSRSIIRTT